MRYCYSPMIVPLIVVKFGDTSEWGSRDAGSNPVLCTNSNTMEGIKLSLTMLLQGRTMLSEQECLRKTRKPLMGKGKKSDKQVIDRNGNPVWVTVKEYDPSKCERFNMDILDNEGHYKPVTVFTRGCKPATKTMNLGVDSYEYFISKEVPLGFHAPKNFKMNFRIRKSANEQAWLQMSETERLEWHLNDICKSQNATLETYNVYEE